MLQRENQALAKRGGDVELSAAEERILAGDCGPALRWALETQMHTARFFGAGKLVPIGNCHMVADYEVMGEAGYDLLSKLAAQGAQVSVPTTTNARCVDFDAAARLFQDPHMVAREREIMTLLRGIGAMLTDTCINYQTVYQPHLGEHVAWGDTGTVIYANSVFGARSNFEAGPAALAAAVTGRVPCYGFHLDEARRGTVLVKVATELGDISDWGALGAAVGRIVNDYWAVPVFCGIAPTVSSDELKHLGASLASYGSLAMFHMVGVTPEAPSLARAFDGMAPRSTIEIGPAAIESVYESYPCDKDEIDLVVLTGPQLSIFELRRTAELLEGRRVNGNTQLIITTNKQNHAIASQLGYVAEIERSGGSVLVGTCFYIMAPGEMRKHFGWSNVLTNSAKFANIIGGYRFHPIFRRTDVCIEAAINGRIG